MCADVQTFSHYPALRPPVTVPLVTIPEHSCSYLKQQQATFRAMLVREMPSAMYQAFMDAAFRRSGLMLYQPVCSGCRRCVPLRVEVAAFKPDKAQRRCWRRNQDLQVSVGEPRPDQEKFGLYQQYIKGWHHRDDADSFDAYVDFLYTSPVKSIEFAYRDAGGRLLAVGICDIGGTALSSVYCYFDPAAAARGLGTFAALREIDYAEKNALQYYYLGYWVDQCGAMVYKSSFKPNELLGSDGIWRRQGRSDRDRIDFAQ